MRSREEINQALYGDERVIKPRDFNQDRLILEVLLDIRDQLNGQGTINVTKDN